MAPKPRKRTIRTIPQRRTPIREQDPRERVRNFAEVSPGYREEDALQEAERCLMCPDQPCIGGCPVNVNIPAFIQKICGNWRLTEERNGKRFPARPICSVCPRFFV